MGRTRQWVGVGVAALVAALLGGGVAQAAGTPTAVSVALSPSTIVADGVSTSTVTVSVTDSHGAAVPGQTVDLLHTDPQVTLPPQAQFQPSTGLYTATLTSSLTPEQVRVVATVQVNQTVLAGGAILTQAAPSTTFLSVVTNAPVSPANLPITNQNVLMVAAVSAPNGGVSPVGTVTFANHGVPIAGCGAVPVSGPGSSLTVTCTTTFSAAWSPAALTAAFAPSSGTFVLPSTSAPYNFAVNRAPTSALVLSPGTANRVDTPVTFTALVTPSQFGPARLSGSVAFFDQGVAIPGCTFQALTGFGTASCTRTYSTTGARTITAAYSGDANFAPASSPPAPVSIQPLGTIDASMMWTFVMTTTGTRIAALDVLNASPGSSVGVRCHGAGCPFRWRTVVVGKVASCHVAKHKKSCSVAHPLRLAGWFRRHTLRPGAQVTVQITRVGWVGKVYQFGIRRRQAPHSQIFCLAPGASRPGVGC